MVEPEEEIHHEKSKIMPNLKSGSLTKLKEWNEGACVGLMRVE